MSFSFGCALVVLLLLECIRYGKVWPLGNYLDSFMRSFTDEKDEGDLILTHIYLLFGCAVPLWLFVNFQSNAPSIVPFAGLLIVGIGDAAVST